MVETTRRQAIEDVASDLFRERGYAATSVRDIARALDIQGPSLYAHVASKEDVLWAIVDRVACRFEEAARVASDVDAAPPDRFAGLVRGHVGVVVSDVGQASVFVHEWPHLSGPRRQAVFLRRDAYEALFRDVIRDGIADGSFVMTDPSLAATFVLTALNGITGWYRPDGHVGPTQLGDVYADPAVRSLTEASR